MITDIDKPVSHNSTEYRKKKAFDRYKKPRRDHAKAAEEYGTEDEANMIGSSDTDDEAFVCQLCGNDPFEEPEEAAPDQANMARATVTLCMQLTN